MKTLLVQRPNHVGEIRGRGLLNQFRHCLTSLCLVCFCGHSPGQGLVKFANNANSLVSSFGSPISGPPGSYYFALLTAPVGTTDPTAFTFSGLYATNTATPGRLQGGALSGVAVTGWQGGETRAFMVCGWSSAWGSTWNPAWIAGGPISRSMIATGAAGGFDPNTGGFLPVLQLFSASTITGFAIMDCLGPYWMGILQQPSNQIVNAGQPASLSVWAQACPLPYFQWYRNGSPILGANGATYQVAHAQPGDAGTYFAHLYNPAWPICCGGPDHYSATASLVVISQPLITCNPQSEFVPLHTNFQMRVEAAGAAPLSYQWFFNDQMLANGTSTSLLIGNLATADLGAYTVVVTNTYGSVTSCPAILSLVPEPAPLVGTFLLNGAEVSGTADVVSFRFGTCNEWGSLQNVIFDSLSFTTRDLGRRFTVTAADDPDFAVVASALTNGTNDWLGCQVQIGAGGFGQCAGERTFFRGLPQNSNGVDLQGFDIESITFQPDQLSLTFLDPVTSISGSVRVFVVFRVPPPPTISLQPLSQTAEERADVLFYASATGTGPLSYHWQFNGADIQPEGTGSQLKLAHVQATQTGAYWAIVTNLGGAVTSSIANLSIISAVQRRSVPGLVLSGSSGGTVNVETLPDVTPGSNWTLLSSVSLAGSPQWYFDQTDPLPSQRFYRSSQNLGTSPLLGFQFVPAITLTGQIGSSIRVDYISQFGPIDNWIPLASVTLTNTSQLYFDTSAVGNPRRLYRVIPQP